MPDCLIMENVSAIHNKKNMPDFQKWLDFLESIGYKTYWQDMNSKDYGVAQNRQRTFAVSLHSDKPYRFPEPIPLEKRLKDYLMDEVPEEYYINSEKAQKLIVELMDRNILPREESGGNFAQQKPVLLSRQASHFEKEIDVANTLMRGTGVDLEIKE